MTEQTAPPPPNRLAEEYAKQAETAWMYSRGGAATLVPGALFMLAVLRDLPRLQGALVAIAACGIYWIRERRWRARRDWMVSTENWWERLDEAPTLITFPRTVYAARRITDRLLRRPPGRYRLR